MTKGGSKLLVYSNLQKQLAFPRALIIHLDGQLHSISRTHLIILQLYNHAA